jgi:hypothetical protein
MNKPEILEYCNICDKLYPMITHQSHVNSKKHKKALSENRLCDDATCKCQDEVIFDFYTLHELS